jgi:hypothetical protein
MYVAITFVMFFQFVVPSYVEGSTSQMFAVDSTQYVYMADSIREGRNEPWVIGSMLTFPNTLWVPVGLSLLLNSTLLVMLANYAVFAISISMLKRGFAISLGIFVPLLLLNPTSTTSLLCVNKEIFDLLSLSLFLYARVLRRNWLLLAALGIALLNRYEIGMVMIVFLMAESRLNPWRKNRLFTLLLLTVVINFAVPLWGGEMLAHRFEEAQSLKVISLFDIMQMHYLYVFAVIPKIAINMFGYIVDLSAWRGFSSWIYIMIFNNIAFAILVLIAATKRILTLRNDIIYFGALGSVIIAQSLVPQPRYFYFLYIMLCLQIAQKDSKTTSVALFPRFGRKVAHA